jgi:hypothetical protein
MNYDHVSPKQRNNSRSRVLYLVRHAYDVCVFLSLQHPHSALPKFAHVGLATVSKPKLAVRALWCENARSSKCSQEKLNLGEPIIAER